MIANPLAKKIVIINPGPSAAYLSRALAEFGFYTIAIFTEAMASRDKYFQVAADIFDQQIHLPESSVDVLVDLVKKIAPIFVINGSDDSAPITDTIMHALWPNMANNPADALDRCDKFRMQEALKRAALPYIQQIKVDKNSLTTLDTDALRFPCFCKPTHGIATMGGFKANNAAEFKVAAQQNAHINSSPEYLIQEFICGDEFVVDTFSYQGQHFISSIQKYHKRLIDNTPAYGYCELVYDQTLWDECAAFVRQCLSATGLHNGFAHTEIFRLPDGSFRLCEVNPRISGIKGYYNQLAHSLHLTTQPRLLAMSVNQEKMQSSSLAQRKGFGRFLCLYNFSDHPLRDPHASLKSFASVKFYDVLKPFGTVPDQGPKNLAQTDLFVMLVHDDPEKVEADTGAIFALEASGNLL